MKAKYLNSWLSHKLILFVPSRRLRKVPHMPEKLKLVDALTLLPGLRRFRQVDATTLRKWLNREAKECTWCGGPVGKGRSTWCGAVCLQEFKLRCCPHAQRRFVGNRDKGICQICERDTILSEKAYNLNGVKWRPLRSGEDRKAVQEEIKKSLLSYGHARGMWREVDHIVPVCEGGGLLGPDNLRLICGECHLDVTNKLVASRKKS